MAALGAVLDALPGDAEVQEWQAKAGACATLVGTSIANQIVY